MSRSTWRPTSTMCRPSKPAGRACYPSRGGSSATSTPRRYCTCSATSGWIRCPGRAKAQSSRALTSQPQPSKPRAPSPMNCNSTPASSRPTSTSSRTCCRAALTPSSPPTACSAGCLTCQPGFGSRLPQMQKRADGYYELPENPLQLPFMFSLRAHMPAARAREQQSPHF